MISIECPSACDEALAGSSRAEKCDGERMGRTPDSATEPAASFMPIRRFGESQASAGGAENAISELQKSSKTSLSQVAGEHPIVGFTAMRIGKAAERTRRARR